jgi:hypothetical protein
MHFTSERVLDHHVTERAFRLGDVSGVLWTPAAASSSAPVPLILLGQPGEIGLRQMYPRLLTRARSAAAQGFASITIELPGTGERAPLLGAERARAELRAALSQGAQPDADVIDRLILPLVDRAVPEWQQTIDIALALPEVSGRVGFSGGVIAVGTRLAAIEPRIAAAGLFAGSYIPSATMADARRVTVPVHVLLQWDDEGNDRRMALELFDAFASKEKTLLANLGGHTGVPAFAGEDAVRFLARHLGAARV